MTVIRRLLAVGLALPVLACSKDGPTQTAVDCTPATATDTITLAEFQGTRLGFTETGKCVSLSGADAQYLLVPQYATQGNEPQQTPYVIGGRSASAAVSLASLREPLALSVARAEREAQGRAQRRLDGRLRAQERALAPLVQRQPAAMRSLGASSVVFEPLRSFKVLGDIDANTFETIGARLQYTGANLLIYVDTLTPAPFADSVLTSLGNLFDQTLFPIDTAAFGPPSDVDGNGRIIVLMTPKVNELVTAASCRTSGFITGYFFGFDIGSVDTTRSNRGEVFYTLAPDPGGTVSCAHPIADVERLIPATFIHELQHMISFGQHVLIRNGQDEVVWLNEGLSLIAEELGSKYYEDKYPTGGRTSPGQLFPDSAQAFIVNNLTYAYDYLASSPDTSITTFESSGSLAERGGAFLFLRWLGDQKGAGIFRSLVQTNRTGIANVAAAANEPFPNLFGDFGIAVYTDSLLGVPRGSVPSRYRFLSRNLRQLFARLQSIGAVGPLAFPITLDPIPAGASRQESMVQGTMDFYTTVATGGDGATSVRFTRTDGRALPATLVPQVGVFRLPQP